MHDSKVFKDMPDSVREYLEQHFKEGHFCMPGPWMFFGLWGAHAHGHDAWGCEQPPWMDEDLLEDAPEEVREYLKQHFEDSHFSTGHCVCAPGPWMFFHHGPRMSRGRRFCRPGRDRHASRGHKRGRWADEEIPDEVKQWFHQRFADWFEDCSPRAEGPSEPAAEEAPTATS